MIYVYTLPICPNCEQFKEMLTKNNIEFKCLDLEDEDVYIDLLIKSVTLTEAPIIRLNDKFMSMNDAIKELGL